MQRPKSVNDQIFALVREMAPSEGARVVDLREAQDKCARKGFTHEMFNECIKTYEDLNIWLVNNARTRITFI